MLPHHAELDHCSISCFLYFSTSFPSATETQELLSHCLWSGINQTCWSSWFGPTWPFPCQLDHSITFFQGESGVLLFTVFSVICLSCQNSHTGRTLFLCAVKGFPLWSKQAGLFFLKFIWRGCCYSEPSAVYLSRVWLNSPNEPHWQQLQKDTSACLFLKLMLLSAFSLSSAPPPPSE